MRGIASRTTCCIHGTASRRLTLCGCPSLFTLNDASREVLAANLQLQTQWLNAAVSLLLYCLSLFNLECAYLNVHWQFALYG